MSQTIKAVALSPIFVAATIIFAIFSATTMASAAPLVDCTQAVQNTHSLAANIASAATNYWAHRQNFVNYKFGNLRLLANAQALAAAERTLAGQLQAPIPNTLTSFRAAIATAGSQNCLSAAALKAMLETAATQARKINFDQFPVEETEATSGPGPKKMPP